MNTILANSRDSGTVLLPTSFVCPVCGKELTVQGFPRHLAHCLPLHGLTRADYERKFSTILYGPYHQFAATWFSLCNFSIQRFGLMDYAGQKWCHINTDRPQPWYESHWGRKPETLPLLRVRHGDVQLRESFYQFRRHLEGKLTLGIWPDMDNMFTMIDLDHEEARHRLELTERLIDLRLHFYVEHSGKKGYHFWIFWDRVLKNHDLVRIHETLAADIPVDRRVWPFQSGLIKLPLGLHRETCQLACFIDYEGNPIPAKMQFAYCLQMRNNPIPASLLDAEKDSFGEITEWDQGRQPEDDNVNAASTPSARSSCRPSGRPRIDLDHCLHDGIKLAGGRHRTLFLLARYLQRLGISADETLIKLSEWSVRVISKHSVSARLRDACSTVQRVFRVSDSVSLAGSQRVPTKQGDDWILPGVPSLTAAEQHKLDSLCSSLLISAIGAVGPPLRKEDVTRRLKSLKRVATTMVEMAKSNQGWLAVGFHELMQRSGVSKQTLRRALAVVVSDHFDVPAGEPDDVLWRVDVRPCRDGGIFQCVARGSFPHFATSVYRIFDDVALALGWPLTSATLPALAISRAGTINTLVPNPAFDASGHQALLRDFDVA